MRPCSTQKHIGDWRVMFCLCLVLGGPCAGCGSSVSRLEVCKHQEGFFASAMSCLRYQPLPLKMEGLESLSAISAELAMDCHAIWALII